MSAYQDRILQEYYDILRTRGQAAADMVYDAYEGAGRFIDGPTMMDRGQDLVSGGKKMMASPAGKKTLAVIDQAADPIQNLLMKGADAIPLGRGGATATRMAGGAIGKAISRGLPVLGAVTAVGDVANLVTGQESLGNKGMDATAMAVGGFLGAAGGPLGIAAGASLGKALSDGAQYLFGDKKTPEQRKMELALQQLQSGGMY